MPAATRAHGKTPARHLLLLSFPPSFTPITSKPHSLHRLPDPQFQARALHLELASMMLCSSRAQPIRSLGSRNEQLSSRLAAHDRLVNPRRGIEDGKRSQSTTRAQEKSACSRDSGINDVTLKHLSSHVTCGPRTLRLRGHSTLDSRAYTATDADPDDVTRRGAASHDRIGYGYGARNFKT